MRSTIYSKWIFKTRESDFKNSYVKTEFWSRQNLKKKTVFVLLDIKTQKMEFTSAILLIRVRVKWHKNNKTLRNSILDV